MQVKLRILCGPNAGREIAIQSPVFLIRCGREAHLRSKSNMVSQRHCAIFVGPDDARIKNLNSRSGTFVNDRRVVASRPLKNGDRVRIGPHEFEVILRSTPESHDTDDSEIAAWLEGGDPEEDNRTGAKQDALQVINDQTAQLDQEFARSAAGSQEHTNSSEASPLVQTPGKLPFRSKLIDIDASHAAADVLKKFFDRR